jgi:hypothetical protein
MNNIANVEYFYDKCNTLLNTGYTSNDWGGEDNKKKSINIEWIIAAVNKVYQKIHQPKNGCRLLLSSRFNQGDSKMAVNEDVVNSVVTYLSKLNEHKLCDNDCACYKDVNCNCVCTSHCNCNGNCPKSGGGSTKVANHCNCKGTYQCNCNCACECGNNTECVCDCTPYDCNCSQVLNCSIGSTRPMTQNCGTACQCNCVCECECACNACNACTSSGGSNGGSGGGSNGGSGGNCSVCTACAVCGSACSGGGGYGQGNSGSSSSSGGG